MKHTLTLLASVAAVVGSTAVAVNVHRAEIQHQLVLDTKAAAVHAQQITAEQAQAHQNALKLQQDDATITKLQDQCKNGVLAYNLLTTSQIKLHAVVKPDCSL